MSVFSFFEYIHRSGIAESYDNFIFLRNFQTVLQSGCAILYCGPPARYEGSSSSTFLSKLVNCLFDYSQPSGYEVESYCKFNLHFPDS